MSARLSSCRRRRRVPSRRSGRPRRRSRLKRPSTPSSSSRPGPGSSLHRRRRHPAIRPTAGSSKRHSRAPGATRRNRFSRTTARPWPGFVLSLVAGALLFLSAGLSSLVSVGVRHRGIVYSRKGKQKVESGETTKNARPGPGRLHHRDHQPGPRGDGDARLGRSWSSRRSPTTSSARFENEFDEDSISAALRVAARVRAATLFSPLGDRTPISSST